MPLQRRKVTLQAFVWGQNVDTTENTEFAIRQGCSSGKSLTVTQYHKITCNVTHRGGWASPHAGGDGKRCLIPLTAALKPTLDHKAG